MKILITGVHGFVGSNLVQALSKEYVIYGLDIVSPVKEGVRFTFGWEDLNECRVPDVDVIIHLAGIAHDTKNENKADEYIAVNVDLTKRIYDYFLASKAKKFIFFSTVKAAADRVKGAFLDENVVPKPRGPYGESKLAAEKYILMRESQCGRQNGKKTYILRPCMIHGPGNKGNLNLLYKVMRKGIPWPLGAFDNKRTFASIDNVSFIVYRLLEADIKSGIYNVNDDEAVSTNELIQIICEANGRKPHIWKISRRLMEGLAKMGGWLHLPLTPERFHKLTEDYVCSNAKIKKAIGVEKLPVKAKDGLWKTVRSL